MQLALSKFSQTQCCRLYLERGDKNSALWNCTVQAVKAPTDLYTLAMTQVSYKERTNTTMVTKN
jgi:hypothetical protein